MTQTNEAPGAATYTDARRWSSALMLRGALLLGLGSLALLWPESFLIAAMLTVGLVAVFLGLHEFAIAMLGRRRSAGWQFAAAHGTLSVAFGALTLTAATLPLRWALWAAAAWCIAYAAESWIASVFAGPSTRARRVLLACAAIQIAIALIAVLFPSPNIFALLYFGAGYAAMLGAWQLGLGTWLRRLSDRGRLAAQNGGADGRVVHRDGQQLVKHGIDASA